MAGGAISGELSTRIKRASGGIPLGEQPLSRMEHGFGVSFADVRVHPRSDLPRQIAVQQGSAEPRQVLEPLDGKRIRRAARGVDNPVGSDVGQQHIIRRHKGRNDPKPLPTDHGAMDHVDLDDQRMHAQREFDEMSTADFKSYLETGGSSATPETTATKETPESRRTPKKERRKEPAGAKVIAVPIGRLPPALQALVRHVQQMITDLETCLGADKGDEDEAARTRERFRARIATGARSWHDDLLGKVPVVDSPPSTRADFFVAWRNEAAAEGKDVIGKQKKNRAAHDSKGGTRPLREYTATGWKEGNQGRLIYDPIPDILYLSPAHYEGDDFYYRIISPRPSAGTMESAATLTRWDKMYLAYQAWEELAVDLQRLASDESTDLPPLHSDAHHYVRELHTMRMRYQQAFAAAREQLKDKERQQDSKIAREEKLNKKNPKTKVTEREEFGEQFSPFPCFGAPFVVGSTNGYIGFEVPRLKDKSPLCPEYDARTTIGDVARLFQRCMGGEPIQPDEESMKAAAKMLAALLAETSRHPPAALEALFAVLPVRHGAPSFKSSTRAYGGAFPMAAGGTIGAGGIAQEVLFKEAQIASLLADPRTNVWAQEPARAVKELKQLLLQRLLPENTEEKEPDSSQPSAQTISPSTPVGKLPSPPTTTDLRLSRESRRLGATERRPDSQADEPIDQKLLDSTITEHAGVRLVLKVFTFHSISGDRMDCLIRTILRRLKPEADDELVHTIRQQMVDRHVAVSDEMLDPSTPQGALALDVIANTPDVGGFNLHIVQVAPTGGEQITAVASYTVAGGGPDVYALHHGAHFSGLAPSADGDPFENPLFKDVTRF